jgi:hypothetical protein
MLDSGACHCLGKAGGESSPNQLDDQRPFLRPDFERGKFVSSS